MTILVATNSKEMELMQAAKRTDSLIAFGITWGPLSICFIAFYLSYTKAFEKHSDANKTNPFLPLMNCTFNVLKTGYPCIFLFGGLFALLYFADLSTDLEWTILIMFVCTVIVIFWLTAAYQLVISLISIHRFINNRQSEELRGTLSQKNVKTIMVVFFVVVIMKDVSLIIWGTVIFVSKNFEMLKTVALYYGMTYFTHQVFLYIGMVFQFATKSDITTTHSEKLIAEHTKLIGAVKFILHVIAIATQLIGFNTSIPAVMFAGIDILLVPVVIQIVEFKTDPNVITPCVMKKDSDKN